LSFLPICSPVKTIQIITGSSEGIFSHPQC
jgi:hypothetical protein